MGFRKGGIVLVLCGLAMACGKQGPASGALSPEQRVAALNAVSSMIVSLAWQSPQAVSDGLLSFLRGRSEFKDVQLTATGNIIARFTDGRWLILYRNFGRAAGPAPAAAAVPFLRTAAAAGPPAELPGSKNALIMTTLGSAGDHLLLGGADAAPDLISYLNARGYQATGPEASLDTLRNVGASTPGIFYLHTHGGSVPFTDGSGSQFALLTSTAVSKELETTDSSLRVELDNGLVGYGATPVDSGLSNYLGLDPTFKYAVGAGFAEAHWKLAPNALVFLNACETSGPDSRPMVDALHANGASLFVGWTGEVDNTVGQNAARYLFDRMLGANTDAPESPKQRPFDWPSIQANMQAKNLTHSSVPGAGGTIQNADLSLIGDGQLGLLAPSIKHMVVDPPPPAGAPPTVAFPQSTELTLQGLFGTRPGKVTIGGTEVTVNSWKPTEVKVALRGTPGAGFDGEVRASVDGIESNVVPLTSWEGWFLYSTEPIGGFPALTGTLTWHAFLRADVHSYRDQPGTAPHAPEPIVFRAAPATTVDWLDSGTVVAAPGVTLSLTGSETLPYGFRGVPAPYGDGYIFDGRMDVSAGQIDAELSFLGCVGNFSDGSSSNPVALPLAPDVISGPTPTGSLSTVPLTLGSDFTIPGGHRVSTQMPTQAPQLDWQALVPRSPPDPFIGEDTQH